MNKTELYNKMIEDVAGIKMSKAAMESLIAIIDTNMKPKAGGGNVKHPALLNDEGEIVEAYCRYFEAYFPAEEMVISKGKSKGYSKVAIGLWNKAQRLTKKMTEKYMDIEDAASDEAVSLKEQIKDLKIECLEQEMYQSGDLKTKLETIEAELKLAKEEA